MRKGIVVALAGLAMGFGGLFAAPAEGLQGGFSVGYNSVGFQLHGMGGEILLGFQGKDGQRPQGSVLRIGLAGAAGTGEADLTEATWNGQRYGDYTAAATAARIAATSTTAGQQAAGALIARIAATGISPAQATAIATDPLKNAYGVTDATKAEGRGSAFLFSVAYEYVLARGAPGLGFIVGGELYVSQGGFSSTVPDVYPSVSTDGGIGGGGVVGISYYLKNGLNFALKTGLGVVNPGKVNYNFPTGVPGQTLSVEVELDQKFYVSPSLSIGFIY